jgi:isovaleryl-CoA dehydrogenase
LQCPLARPRVVPAPRREPQIHGGYGFTREFEIERHLRDAKLCEIGAGTSQVRRLVIAKHLLRE